MADTAAPRQLDGHLLSLAGLSADTLRSLLTDAREFADATEPPPSLAGRTVALLFLEDSTRTRSSFRLAAERLGARAVDLTGVGSSVSKGESLIDTARTIEAMGIDAMAVRTKEACGPAVVAEGSACPVINAGDGRHEHPTQGLLDALTLARALGRDRDFDLTGLRIAVVGDLGASRVFRSDVSIFTALGAEVIAVGPTALAPGSLERLGCRVERDLDAVIPEIDAVQMLRVQFERHGGTAIASRRQYRGRFGLTRERGRAMKDGAVVMHPGPMNRGLEIDHEVAEGGPDLPRPLILEQVTNGVFVRMAVLNTLVNGPLVANTKPAGTANLAP